MTIDTRGPDPDAIARYILERFPDTVVANAYGATFFSCDGSNWPNFATITTTDENDTASNLSREGVFRLNIGVSPATFDGVVGDVRDPDFTQIDRLMPHPVYAPQQWVCVLNPSESTFEAVVKPLLDEAHERVVAKAQARRKD